MSQLITSKKSIIPACDMPDIEKLQDVVMATRNIKEIGGYKIGSILTMSHGLNVVTQIIKGLSDKRIIYDHQKAGTDTPNLGSQFARVLRTYGVHAAILFPFGGTVTEEIWIKALQDQGVHVIVGSEMTHAEFLEREGGYITNGALYRIFEVAMKEGVRDFVVPGNKLESVVNYKKYFLSELGPGNYTLYAPGFVSQGGDISKFSEVAGDNWHAIVGTDLYMQPDEERIRNRALELVEQL